MNVLSTNRFLSELSAIFDLFRISLNINSKYCLYNWCSCGIFDKN